MSLLNWFAKKQPAHPPMPVESSGLGHVDATVPFSASGKPRGHAPVAAPGSAANRKNERLERRELLYSVVREAMIKAGVLSSTYKFKVLSLDSRGRQYLIMMDLAKQFAGETGRLAEIEGVIAQNAKTRHDIVVTSVYWRISEHVSAGLSRSGPAAVAHAPAAAAAVPVPGSIRPVVSKPPLTVVPSSTPKPGYEPLHPEEVAAFKQALAAVSGPKSLSAPGEIIRSGRRNPAPEVTFDDTEVDDRPSPLSGTQYGDL